MKLIPSKGSMSSRVPRSKWTVQEMLCLVEAKKESVDEDGEDGAGVEWLMQGAAHRAPFVKWQAVASACSSKCGAKKSHTQCFLKWRRLIKPWRAIYLTGPDQYWLMTRDERKAAGLPLSFNRKIFNAILHAFNTSDNVKRLPPPQDPRDIKEATKSSTIDLIDNEELPSVKIEEEEELQFLQREEEEDGGWDSWGLIPSPFVVPHNPTVGQPEGSQKRNSLDARNCNNAQHDKNYARIPNECSAEDNRHSRVAETSHARPTPWDNGRHTNLSSQENNVEENHMEENIHMEEKNDMQECSASLRLDKETIGKFLESISSMAKVMEAIVRALTE